MKITQIGYRKVANFIEANPGLLERQTVRELVSTVFDSTGHRIAEDALKKMVIDDLDLDWPSRIKRGTGSKSSSHNVSMLATAVADLYKITGTEIPEYLAAIKQRAGVNKVNELYHTRKIY